MRRFWLQIIVTTWPGHIWQWILRKLTILKESHHVREFHMEPQSLRIGITTTYSSYTAGEMIASFRRHKMLLLMTFAFLILIRMNGKPLLCMGKCRAQGGHIALRRIEVNMRMASLFLVESIWKTIANREFTSIKYWINGTLLRKKKKMKLMKN